MLFHFIKLHKKRQYVCYTKPRTYYIYYQKQMGTNSYLNTITAMLTRKHDNSDDMSTYIWFLCRQRYILIKCTQGINKMKTKRCSMSNYKYN